MTERAPLHAGLLVTCLAVREADRLRALSDVDQSSDITARDWRTDADWWAKRMQPGDELWTWSTPRWTWEDLCGRGGFAIVRDGKPIYHSWTVMN
jgi:hypothetical protein